MNYSKIDIGKNFILIFLRNGSIYFVKKKILNEIRIKLKNIIIDG